MKILPFKQPDLSISIILLNSSSFTIFKAAQIDTSHYCLFVVYEKTIMNFMIRNYLVHNVLNRYIHRPLCPLHCPSLHFLVSWYLDGVYDWYRNDMTYYINNNIYVLGDVTCVCSIGIVCKSAGEAYEKRDMRPKHIFDAGTGLSYLIILPIQSLTIDCSYLSLHHCCFRLFCCVITYLFSSRCASIASPFLTSCLTSTL